MIFYRRYTIQIVILLGLAMLFFASCSPTTTTEPLPTLIPTAAISAAQPKSSLTSSLPPTNTPFVPATNTPIMAEPTVASATSTVTSVLPTFTPPAPMPTSPDVILPTLTPIRSFQGTPQQFEAYIRENYSQIDGQPLGIESVAIHDEGGELGFRSIWIHLSEAGANTLTNYPQSSMYLYGERLMDDGLAFFSGESFSIVVSYRL